MTIGPETQKAIELAQQITQARAAKAMEMIKDGSSFTQTKAAKEMAATMRMVQAQAAADRENSQSEEIFARAMERLGLGVGQ